MPAQLKLHRGSFLLILAALSPPPPEICEEEEVEDVEEDEESMNLVIFSKRYLWSSARVLYYSTQTLAFKPRDSLYRRISPIGDPTVSIIPVLDGWIEDGNTVEKQELQLMVKQLRGYKRYNHALQMSEWMTCKRYFDLTPGDTAVRLHLISKVHGLEQAEKFFNNIPKRMKTIETFSALLNCYAQKKDVEKVETLLKTMKALGFLNSVTYNVLLNFYYQMGQYEKLDLVMEEMKEIGIPFDIVTFRTRMCAYVAASDINGMESILKRMEDDPKIVLAWDIYSTAANGYIKAGLADKAVVMLKKSEALTTQDNWVACNFLLTLYASIGWKDDVYRIWNLLNSSSKNITNKSYLSMIVSLTKLDDIEGAEKIVEEWESTCFCYDFRVPNRLIAAYCKKGLFHKAESFISKAIERGRTPNPSTWQCMATGYVVDNQISKGVEMMKAALSANRTGWKPNTAILAACLEFFEKQGDVEGLEDFIRLLRLRIPLTRDVYHRLLRTHLVTGKPVSDVLNRMKEDGVDADEETEEILRGSPD